jgi:hypothetical protein
MRPVRVHLRGRDSRIQHTDPLNLCPIHGPRLESPDDADLSIHFHGILGVQSRIEHQCIPFRTCRVTRRFGLRRKTSEGRYRCCLPHRPHSTASDLKGNSFSPVGTSRLHRLHVTTKTFWGDGPGNMETALANNKRTFSTVILILAGQRAERSLSALSAGRGRDI